MADNPNPNDITPAEKFGEVKVIKNEKQPREEDKAGRPGGTPEIKDPAQRTPPGKTPGKAEG